jgi:hypothetical protein
MDEELAAFLRRAAPNQLRARAISMFLVARDILARP